MFTRKTYRRIKPMVIVLLFATLVLAMSSASAADDGIADDAVTADAMDYSIDEVSASSDDVAIDTESSDIYSVDDATVTEDDASDEIITDTDSDAAISDDKAKAPLASNSGSEDTLDVGTQDVDIDLSQERLYGGDVCDFTITFSETDAEGTVTVTIIDTTVPEDTNRRTFVYTIPVVSGQAKASTATSITENGISRSFDEVLLWPYYRNEWDNGVQRYPDSVTIAYSGDDTYAPKTVEKTLTVYPFEAEMEIDITQGQGRDNNITYGNPLGLVLFEVLDPFDFNNPYYGGNFNVYIINGDEVDPDEFDPTRDLDKIIKKAVVNINDGDGSITFDDILEEGYYLIGIYFDEVNFPTYVAWEGFNVIKDTQVGPFVVSSNGIAYQTLADALAVAIEGDTITVIKEGIYKGVENTGLTIAKSVTIAAAGDLDVTFDCENLNNFITVASGNEVTLKDFIIRNGYGEKGGAVYVENDATLTVDGVGFSHNTANTRGGAIYSEGIVAVFNSKFYQNDIITRNANVDNGGAAIYNAGGKLFVDDSRFDENLLNYVPRGADGTTGDLVDGVIVSTGTTVLYESTFYKNSGCYGGAVTILPLDGSTPSLYVGGCEFIKNDAYDAAAIHIENVAGDVTINNCLFEGNNVGGTGSPGYGPGGGAIFITKLTGQGTISNSSFVGNKAPDGGAINVQRSTLTIDGCNFTDNTGGYGAGVSTYISDVTIKESNFINNTVTIGGAAVCLDGASVSKIIDSVFTGNNAPIGAAIADYSEGTTTIEGCTITDNVGTETGAVYVNDEVSSLTIKDSTFVNNTAPDYRNIYTEVVPATLSGNTFDSNETTLSVNDISYGEDEVINGTYDSGTNLDFSTPTATITINGQETTAVANRTAFTKTIEKPNAGNYTAILNKLVDSNNNVILVDNLAGVYNAAKAVADVQVEDVEVTYPAQATIVVKSNVTGTYTIRVGNKDYEVEVDESGEGSVLIDLLEAGVYDIDLSADFGDNYEPISHIPIAKLTVNAQTGPFVVSSNGLGYATLAEALAVAVDGDTITVVEAGTYTGEGNIGVTINKDVTIKAGEGLDVVFDAQGADTNILTIANGKDVELEGLGFTGVENVQTKYGAVVNHGTLTVTDCDFYDNTVKVNGASGSNGAAAIFSAADASGLTITGSSFKNNVATPTNPTDNINTGGIGAVASWATSGTVVIKDSVFENNEARFGGAVEIENLNQVTPVVSGCNFTDNVAYVGAGINFNDGCKLELVENCIFTGNTIKGPQGAPTTGSMGAAICAGSATGDSVLMVDSCKFIGNKGDASDGSSGGAIRLANKASGAIFNSEFIGNEARLGSAISIGTINNDAATLVVENCNFTDNNALFYGAVSIDSEAVGLSIADSTFSGNTAPENRNIFNMGTLVGVVRNTFDINDTEIKVNDIPYGLDEVINGTFDAGVNFDLTGATVSLTIGGEEVTATVTEGNAFTTTVTKPDVGTYAVVFNKVTDSDNNEYVPESAVETSYTVYKSTPIVEVNDTTAEWNTTVTIPVKVTDEEGNPLTGTVIVTVDWTVDGKTVIVELNESGEAEATFIINEALGQMTITANFTGDDNHKSAIGTASLTIEDSSDANLEVTAPEEIIQGDTLNLNATLTNGRDAPIADATLTYTIDDGEPLSVVTGEDGTVTIPIEGLPIGTHTIVVNFDDGVHTTATQSVTVKVSPKKGTYTDLQYQIDQAIRKAQEEGLYGPKLDLPYDFAFDEEYDLANNPDFINGVVISSPIIIEGNGYRISGEGKARIFNISSELAVLEHLTLFKGHAEYGGAIYADCEKLNMYDVIFDSNDAVKGGAIYLNGSESSVSAGQSVFSFNKANEGGAIYQENGFLSVDGEFVQNIAHNNGGAIYLAEGVESRIDYNDFKDNIVHSGLGSAIYINKNCDVNIAVCNFERNTGYAVYVDCDNVEIEDSNFGAITNNGGAVYWVGNNGKLTGCNFTENYEFSDGALVNVTGDNFVIDSCIFSGFEAGGNGTVIYANGDKLKVVDSIFENNEVTNDGIIYLDGNSADFDNVTFESNKAGKGAIAVEGATITVADSHFKDNSGLDVNFNIYNQGTIESITGTTFETIKPTITMDDSFAFGEIIPVNGTFDWGVASPEITMNFTVNGAPLDASVLDGKFAMNIDTQPDAGTYTLVISTFTDDKGNTYVVDTVQKTFEVAKATPILEVEGDDYLMPGENATVGITLTGALEEGIAGTVIVTVDGKDYVVQTDENGEGTLTIEGLVSNKYPITAKFLGNDNYETVVNDTEFIEFYYKAASFDIVIDDITYGDAVVIIVENATDLEGNPLSGMVFGNIQGDDDGDGLVVYVTDGSGTATITRKLAVGTYNVTSIFSDADYEYISDSKEFTFDVLPAAANINATAANYAFDETGKLVINVTDLEGNALNGTVAVEVDNEILGTDIAVVDGGVEIDLTGYAIGEHSVRVIFDNANFTNVEAVTHFNVTKKTPVVSVTGAEVEYGTPATVKVKVTDEDGNPITGTVIVVAGWAVDAETQVVELNESGEGEATFVLDDLAQDTYANINATYIANDNYTTAYNDTEKIHITNSTELSLEVTANEATLGEDTILNVVATDGAGAEVPLTKVNVTINGVTKEYDVDEDGNVNVGKLPVGETEITVSVDDGFHEPAQDAVNATVKPAAADVTVTPGEGNVSIEAKDKEGNPISDTATIIVDGGEPITVPIDETGKIEYPIDATPGPHTVEVTFNNDDYEPVNKTVTVIVPKYTTELSIATEDTPTYGDDVTVKATITEGATGTITYYVDGSSVGTELAIGQDFVVTGLSAGEHNITAKYAGDDNYAAVESNILTINVAKAELVVTIDSAQTYYPNTGTVEVSANNDGVYTITVNDKDYTVNITGGKGSFNVTEVLPVAEYPITWDIAESENYTGATGNAVYKVLNTAPDFSITGSSEINYGNTNTIVPTINDDATGTITYTINGENPVTLGLDEEFVTDVLDAGHYTVSATYSGDVNYGSMTKTLEFDVLPIDVVVSVSSDEVYYPNTGSINLTASAPGTYTVLVGNKTYTATVSTPGETVIVSVDDLFEVGKYEINVTAPASTNYNAVDTGAIGTYVVSKARSVIEVTYDPATGIATVTLEGEEDHVKLNESISFELDGEPRLGAKTTEGVYESGELNLAPGKHSIFVVFVGNENYLGSYDQISFEIDKFTTAEVTVTADPIKEGEDAIINITVMDGDKGLNGVVTVTLDGTDYAVNVEDGKGTLTVKNLVATETPTTTYPITAKFNGNDEYGEATGTGSIDVTDYNDVIVVISGGDSGATATLIDSDLNPINGKVNVTVDGGEPQEYDVVDGKVNIPIEDEGDHDITVDYLGDDTHKPASESATVYVGKKLIATTLTVTIANITYTEDAEAVILLQAEDGSLISGTVNLTIGDMVKEVTITNGKGTTKVSGLNANSYVPIAEFTSDGVYASATATTSLTVRQMNTRIVCRNMTTTAINVTEDGRIGEYFTWTLVDEKGRPVAGKAMSIGFNANVYNRVTDANGQAKLQINLQNSGTYTFAITFLGDDNYNGSFEVVKIVVNKQKASLTASGATYKASASTKTLSATYKTKAGKPIVGKTIKFTVNGKTYSAKTNSNGVAKVNVSLKTKGSCTVEVKAPATNTYAETIKKVTLKLT